MISLDASRRRRSLLLATLLVAVAANANARSTREPIQQPPNIVMLMMDDLDVSVWQNALDRGLLPRIQRDVINHGTTFENMFVVESMCCPSRATYLTGQYPHNHGVVDNSGKNGGFASFKHDESTVGNWLHAAGYRTGLFGKYLNGYGQTKIGHDGSYIPPGWEHWGGLMSIRQYDYYMSVQGQLVFRGDADEDYQEDVLTGMAADFLNKSDARPFFLTLTPTAPHYEGREDNDDDGVYVRPAPRYENTPRLKIVPSELLPSFNEDDMRDKPKFMRSLPPVSLDDQRAGYNSKVASIRAVDDMLGAVVDNLNATGRLSNTLIIITSDNGFQFGLHRRVGKTDLYEESIRVPMVIRAPAQTVPRRTNAWAMNVDWAPTIVDFARAKADIVIDGVSLRPLLQGDDSTQRKTILVEHPTGDSTGVHRKQRAVRSQDPSVTGDPRGKTTLVYLESLTEDGDVTDVEFYDLSVDPYQIGSLHKSREAKRIQQMKWLKDRLHEMAGCAGERCVVE